MTLRRPDRSLGAWSMNCLSLHGSNDLEAEYFSGFLRRRESVSASTEAMTLRRGKLDDAELPNLGVSASTEAMTLRRQAQLDGGKKTLSLSLHGSNDLEAEFRIGG